MSKLTIVMYHYVRDLAHSAYPAIKGLDLKLFEEQLDFLLREFTPVRMEDVLEVLEMDDKGALPDNALLLTFDDGYIDHYETVYPLLKKHGIQGSFFIPGKTFTEHALLDVNKIHFILAASGTAQLKADLLTELDALRAAGTNLPSSEDLYAQYGHARMFDDADTIFCKSLLQSALPEDIRSQIASKLFKQYVGMEEEDFSRKLYMTKEQMQEMKADGMFFGLHGYDHYWMNALTPEQLRDDMEKALKATSDLIDADKRVINYPYGRVSPEVVDYMKSIGCKAGVTIERGTVDLAKADPFLLPRFDCNDFPPKSKTYLEVG